VDDPDAADREARLAENQALFRMANERLEERVEEYGAGDSIPFLCECADVSCLGRIDLTLSAYREVRANPSRFVILPGHAMTEGERVVAERTGFQIVEKTASGS
jgi:hypothetical protein